MVMWSGDVSDVSACVDVWPCSWEQDRPGQHSGQYAVPQREYWVPHWAEPPLRERHQAGDNKQINITANIMVEWMLRHWGPDYSKVFTGGILYSLSLFFFLSRVHWRKCNFYYDDIRLTRATRQWHSIVFFSEITIGKIFVFKNNLYLFLVK